MSFSQYQFYKNEILGHFRENYEFFYCPEFDSEPEQHELNELYLAARDEMEEALKILKENYERSAA